MKAYKATYNFKCRDQLYRVGKLYTSDKLQICKHGFHYCLDMQDTLNYYLPQVDFVLLEIEVLGKHETQYDKGATDKMRVLRVVPPEEYPEHMRKRFDVIERDQNNRIVSRVDPYGHKMVYQYDDRGNMIVENDTKMDYDDNNQLVRKTFPSGNFFTFTYDERGNCIFPSGNFFTFTYDERGNCIATKDNQGYHEILEYDEFNRLTKQTYATNEWYEYAYDDRGNKISSTDSHGHKYTYQYDELNRQINYTTPTGRVYTFEYANITEED